VLGACFGEWDAIADEWCAFVWKRLPESFLGHVGKSEG
jgi:hypothetical protein